MTGTATAPASSANLGPGYDVLAIAWELRCTVAVEPAPSWEITSGAGPVDEETTALVQAAAGGDAPHRVAIAGDIPIGKGLGSSAALIVATRAAAIRATGAEPDDDELFAAAAAVEGHPDNVAAAVYGGLVATAGGTCRRLPLSDRLVALLAVPAATLATAEARGAIPPQIEHAAAVRSVARALFLVDGLRTGDAATLAAAAGDELHELHRAPLAPVTGRLVEAAYDAGAGYAAWSGAGPSVVAFTTGEDAAAVAAALQAALGDQGDVMRPQVAERGWS